MDKTKMITAVVFAVAAIFIILILSGKLTFKDDRSTTDRIGDAVHALPDGADKAADQLGDRTTGQRIGDQIRQTGK